MDVFEISAEYKIVSYNTNIYSLYDEMFNGNDPEDMDILQTLKSRAKDPEQRKVFDDMYTDILLVFDLDMQDARFSPTHLLEMQRYFAESSDMGKLYINYPMVESFYHMGSFPDPEYMCRKVGVSELRDYKQRVNRETKGRDYRKYAATQMDWIYVIEQNLQKGFMLVDKTPANATPNAEAIMNRQFNEIEKSQTFFVLCTCIFFIADYNPNLLKIE